MITILQNYICTDENRLKLLKDYFPGWQKQFSEYKFIVNYNHTINFDVIKNLYNQYIPNYELFNNLEKDWAKTTLELVSKIDTKYTMILIEDFKVVSDDLSYFNNMLKECLESECNFILMHKIKKYTNQQVVSTYEEKKYSYMCDWEKYPGACMSIVAIFDTDVLKLILQQFLKQDRTKTAHKIHTPNSFEDFYSKWNDDFMKNDLVVYLNDFNIKLKAAIPKKEVVLHDEGLLSVKQRDILDGRLN